jgi:peptide/nickel transport system ATP-binding protein
VPFLSVRNLRVHFKVREPREGWVRAVDGVSFDLDEGETIGLVGESGCGKTTLAYAITQLLPANAHVRGGQVFFRLDDKLAPYRREYWDLAEGRVDADIGKTRAELEGLRARAVDAATAERIRDLEERVEVLRHPLSETYRAYLGPEVRALRAQVARFQERIRLGDGTARKELREAQSRLTAASQEGDLIAVTRRSDGRLRDYHPALSAIRWKHISIVFQGAMNALNPVHRVGDQIVEAIRTHEEITPDEAKKRVEALFKLVGIPTDRIENYPHEYSGGMKQRAMIAMALALDPKLVIMDEPTTALDVITASKIMDEVLRIQQDLKMALIIISHDVSVVAKVADRIAVMYAGQLVEESTSEEIFGRTLHPYTEGLLGAFPSITGPKRRLESIPGSPPSLVNPPGGCRFHPRCRYAKDICTTQEPGYVRPANGHRALCHFSQDFFASGGLGAS